MHLVRRTVTAVAGAAAFLLPGCADLPHEAFIAGAARACLTENKRFTDAWGCVQARSLAAEDAASDPRSKDILKLGDDLATRVAAKTLKDADARQRLSAQLVVEDTGILGAFGPITGMPPTMTP